MTSTTQTHPNVAWTSEGSLKERENHWKFALMQMCMCMNMHFIIKLLLPVSKICGPTFILYSCYVEGVWRELWEWDCVLFSPPPTHTHSSHTTSLFSQSSAPSHNSSLLITNLSSFPESFSPPQHNPPLIPRILLSSSP